LVRKSLKNSGGSHDFENRFFIDSYKHCEAGHVRFLISSGRLKKHGLFGNSREIDLRD